jgi:hypothetical protein
MAGLLKRTDVATHPDTCPDSSQSGSDGTRTRDLRRDRPAL